jgi:single-strand DNA-binding protein
MSLHINRVLMTGNLCADPDLRDLPSGKSVCELRVATNTSRRNASGDWEAKPNYFTWKVFGEQAHLCARYLAKGRPVALDGRAEHREWTTPEGARRQTVDFVAINVQFLPQRSREDAVAQDGDQELVSGEGSEADPLEDLANIRF